MPEVFIAYAREDEPFARRLHDALSSSGREPVWDQDHAAVPFSMPWRQEIREAIQNSDKFIYIISPDSLASEPCANELAQALELSKQVIPILRRMPGEGQAVPKAIEELNWILFGEDAEFGCSFRRFSTALDIDVAWTKTHTRLLGRAAQWASSRDRSLLLRGSELRMAEAWLGEAAEHEKTPPTRIQRDYISRSRQAADRAARRWRGALAAGLAVAIALAATALVQRGQAIGQRNQAIREARVSLSGKLAANSGALDATDPTTASLLAAAAWRIFPTEQARESMLDALAQPERRILPVSTDDGVDSMAFSPDGKMLATGTFSGQVRLWSTAGHAIGAPLRGGTGINDDATGLDFSPDGKLLATASGQGLIRVWDVATHHQIGTPMAATSSRSGLLASVAFSPDGKLLATGINDFSDTSRILLWDVTTHRQIGTPLPGGVSLAFSPDGKILAGAGNDGSTVLWDVATHRQVGASLAATTAAPAHPVASVAFSPNGRTLAAVNANGTVRLWKLATHRQIGASMSAGTGVEGPAALAFSLDGKTLATTDLTGHVRLWDTATHQQTGLPIATSTDCDSAISAITFSPVTDFLATAGCDGTVRFWDIALYHHSGGVIRNVLADLFNSSPELVFSPDGKALFTPGIKASAWDVATRRLIAAFNPKEVHPFTKQQARLGRFFDNASSISVSKDWKILATASFYGIRLWDMATHRQIGGTLPSGADGTPPSGTDGPVLSPEVAVSPDATMLATVTGDNGDARLWQVTVHRQSGPPLADAVNLGHRVRSVRFSPDGKILATADITGQIRLWETATRHQLGVPFVAGSAIMSFSPDANMSFSPDGKFLAVSNGNSVRFWNVAAHRPNGAPLVASPSHSVVTAFSPDGAIAATATDEGQVQLWDMATRRQIGQPLTPADQSGYLDAIALSFSPDGKILATMGASGVVSFWDVAFPHELLRPVCAIASKAMTHEQWNTYISTQPFEPICSSK